VELVYGRREIIEQNPSLAGYSCQENVELRCPAQAGSGEEKFVSFADRYFA
jgi:hypothetical protein